MKLILLVLSVLFLTTTKGVASAGVRAAAAGMELTEEDNAAADLDELFLLEEYSFDEGEFEKDTSAAASSLQRILCCMFLASADAAGIKRIVLLLTLARNSNASFSPSFFR